MKALGLLKRWGKSRGNRRKQRGGWRGSAGSGLQIEPLEQRRMLSVSASLLADLHVEDGSSPSDFVEAGGTTFFVAEDSLVGRELWKTDGTAEGTEVVKDIYPGGYGYDEYDDQGNQHYVDVRYSSDPQDLVAVNGKVYFTADDGEFGRELWVSDGTAGGTQMVDDLYEGEHSDGSQGYVPNSSDPQELTNVNGALFFTATDGVHGREVWGSNGTAQSTAMIKDINPADISQGPNGSSPQELTAVEGDLLFTADDGTTGRKVWVSNGTEEGTIQVADGATGSDPASLTIFNGALYFAADDGVDGTELWRTDGTGGVEQVDDINPGADGSDPDQLTVVDGTLYFIANNGDDGTELWKTDGSGGVVQVEDINVGADGSNPTWLTNVDGTLYFAANDGTTGTELWKADGAGGASLVEDIYADSESSNPSNLVNMNGALYFSADDGVHGSEVWVSDGTGAGTFLLADIYAGGDGSDPTALANVNGTLFFSADDGAVNQEPWTFAPAQLAIYINGQQETIPAQIGVDTEGNVSEIYTLDDSGTLLVSGVGDNPAPETVTLGDFFETWQDEEKAGIAGSNPDAVFNDGQILDNSVNADHRIQVFVNGIPNHDFEDYAIQGGDEIAIVYTSNEVVSLNFNVGSVLIELLDGAAPGTVANFFNYANDGDWINTFVHRSMSNFVVQLGGFTTTETYFGGLSQFDSVWTDPAIPNEFGVSNTRGTIAMAKMDGDPNSATSQFFFNVGDNSANLDAQNGGFTVFAEVLNMDVVDMMNAYSTRDLDGSQRTYDNVPFTQDNELVVVESIGGEGEVYGVVFDDLDGDGVQDTGEDGRAGVTLFIDENSNGVRDEGEFSTTSDASGDYRFHYKSGQYVLRQELGDHRYQTSAADGHSVSVQIGRETAGGNFGSLEVLPPTGVDLVAATDSATDNDDLTNFNNSTTELALQFDVTGGTTGAHILVYAGDVLIGSASAASLVTVTTNGVTALDDGVHEITASQMLFGIESARSDLLPITIDTVAPADFETVAPVIARLGELYEYDAYSPDEDTAGATISLVGAPDGMDVTQAGEVTWTPTAAQQGVHEFEIRITDDAGNYSSESVMLTVLGDPPAYPDYYDVDEDGELSPDAEDGLLRNDGENETGLVGTATVVSDVSHGELELYEDGSFTYVPEDDFSGTDMFIYMVTTDSGDTNEAPVKITVHPVNDPPVAVADSYVVAEDGLLEVTLDNGLLGNDSDVDSAQMIASVVDRVEHGSLNPQPDGTFTYEPDADYFGTDTFTYWAVDDAYAQSEEVTVTITITAVNDAPEVIDSEHEVLEDGELDVPADSGVLAGATDVEGDELTAEEVDLPDDGTLTLNADGSFTYEPNDNFYGTDSFTFRAWDGTDWSDEATVTIDVQAQPDPPSAEDDEYEVTGGDTVVLDVRENDTTDPDDDDVESITIIEVSQGSEGGEITISADKTTVEYLPESAFSGTETFTYTIEDGDGLTSVATVTVTVTNWQGVISGFVYCDFNDDGVRDANEAGVPGARITLTGVDDQDNRVEEFTWTSSDGSYSFDELPPGTYEIDERQPLALNDGQDTIGSAGGETEDDHFFEIALTANGESVENNFGELGLAPAFIRLDMFFASTPPVEEYLGEVVARAEKNDAPTAADDTYQAVQNGGLDITASVGVLANDNDVDGSPPSPLTSLAITEINYSPADPTLAELTTDPSFDNDDFEFIELKNVGAMTIDLGGVEFTEGVDFAFTGSDATELAPGNTVLVVSNLSAFEARYGTGPRVAGEFSGTLSDEGERVRLEDAFGSAIHDFVYDDQGDWPTEAAGGGRTLEVVDLRGDYDDPFNWTASNDLDGSPGVASNTAAAVDRLMAMLVDGPSHGDLTLGDDGSFTYTPDEDYFGFDSFTYRASDGTDASEEAEVTIEITPSG